MHLLLFGTWLAMGKKLPYLNLIVIKSIGYQHRKTCTGHPKKKKSAAKLAEGMVKGNKLSKAGKSITCGKCKGIGHNQRKCPNDASTQTATQTQQSSQAPPATQATQASQIGHTTPFHPSQLHASPTKMTKASAARRSST
nr:transposase, mutator type [Tanacetum cinerariifolium]